MNKSLTLKVLCTLPLLARLADDFDGPAWEGTDHAFGFVFGRRSHDLHESLHLFLLLVDVGDEELLADATTNVGGARRRV